MTPPLNPWHPDKILLEKFLHLRDLIFSRRFLYLFLALLIPYLIHPFIGTELEGLVLLDLSFTLVLIMGVFAASDRKHLAATALGIVILAQALTWSSRAVSNHVLILTGLMVNAIYLIYTVAVLLRHVIVSRSPTRNTIFASLCIYLLLGYIWAFFYSFLQDIHPASFYFNPAYFAVIPHGKHLYSETFYFLYYSFTTLTTLGIGDIVPATPLSRMLTAMEAVLGQLYLVVMVTYLVGMHLSKLNSAHDQKD
ncbi:MAG TPA: hypothetical protein DF383_09515 [Deltaproteobacteria bacterium]|nr:hypothetical protein [Deltaproteobacteria bacterium]